MFTNLVSFVSAILHFIFFSASQQVSSSQQLSDMSHIVSSGSHIPSSEPSVVVESMPPTLTPAPQLTSPLTTPTKPAPMRGLTPAPQVQPSPSITATLPHTIPHTARQSAKTVKTTPTAAPAPQPSPKPISTTLDAASLAHALPAKPVSQTADGGKKKMTFVVPKGHQLVMRTGPDGKSQFVTVPKSQLSQAQQKSQLLTQVTSPPSQTQPPQTVLKTQAPVIKSPPKPARTLSPTQFLQKSEVPETQYVTGATHMYPTTSAVTSDMTSGMTPGMTSVTPGMTSGMTSVTPGMTSMTSGMTSEEIALAEAEHAAEMLLGMSGALVPQATPTLQQAPPPVQQQPITSQQIVSHQPQSDLVAQQPVTHPQATAVPMGNNPDGTQQYLLIVDDPKNPGQQQQLIINYTPDKPGGQLDLQQILDALASGGQF